MNTFENFSICYSHNHTKKKIPIPHVIYLWLIALHIMHIEILLFERRSRDMLFFNYQLILENSKGKCKSAFRSQCKNQLCLISFFKISLQDQMFTFLYPIIIWQEVLKLTQFSHTVLCFKEHLILYVFNCMLTLQGFGLTTEDNI